jgi:hypothetical protein
MSRTGRLTLYLPFALLLALALGYTTYWFVAVSRIEAELERLNRGQILPGVTLAFASQDVGGFPFRFDVLLEGVTVSNDADNGATAWRSERVALHAMSYGRAHYILEADGLQTFSWPGDDGALTIMQMTPGLARASAILVDGALARFDLDVLNLSGEDVSQGVAPERAFSAARAQLHLMAQGDDAILLVVSLNAANIGAGFRPALGSDLSRLRIDGQFTQATALAPLRAGAADADAALENWRMADGELILMPVDAAWGGAQLIGEGAFALDEMHRWTGNVSAAPEDPVSFLGALAQSEMIPQETRAQIAAFRQIAGAMGDGLNIPIRLEAALPFGDGAVMPLLRFEGNGMTVEFRSEETP